MTRITFRQVGHHFIASFTGHANAKRENGNDLVCAAISILAQSLAQATCEELARGNLAKITTIKQDERDGALSIDATATEAGFQHVLGAFSAIASGCALLSDKYPDNVTLGRDFQAYQIQ